MDYNNIQNMKLCNQGNNNHNNNNHSNNNHINNLKKISQINTNIILKRDVEKYENIDEEGSIALENLRIKDYIKKDNKNQNLDYQVFLLIKQLDKMGIEIIFEDLPKRLKGYTGINCYNFDVLNRNIDLNSTYPTYKRFMSGKYVLLLFENHCLAVLANKCNIQHCDMIHKASDLTNGFCQPNMIFNTPIVNLTEYSNNFHYNKLLTVVSDLLTDNYFSYKKDEISINFYKAIGFDSNTYLE